LSSPAAAKEGAQCKERSLSALAAKGSSVMGLWTFVAVSARAAFGQATFRKFAGHQVRFGMRWSSNDAAIAK
jgi:hypothetical protein